MKKPVRHNESTELGDLLKIFIEKFNLTPGLQQVRMEEVWKEQMGQGVNAYTEKVVYKNDILYVYLTSAALREELNYGKDKIIRNLNEALEGEYIKDVKLL